MKNIFLIALAALSSTFSAHAADENTPVLSCVVASQGDKLSGFVIEQEKTRGAFAGNLLVKFYHKGSMIPASETLIEKHERSKSLYTARFFFSAPETRHLKQFELKRINKDQAILNAYTLQGQNLVNPGTQVNCVSRTNLFEAANPVARASHTGDDRGIASDTRNVRIMTIYQAR